MRSDNPAQPSDGVSSPRLLVVEDDEHLRATMVRALRFCGYVVDIASNARDGRRCIERERYDAVVTDIAMENNGFSVLALIGQIDDDVPVIAVSGLETPGLDEIVREAGAQVFLQKPFGLAALRDAVGYVLGETDGT